MKKIIKFLSGEKMCFASLFASMTMLFTFAFIEDPRKFTISMIGIERPIMFFVLCVIMVYTVLINFLYFTKKIGYERKGFKALIWFCCLAMLVAGVTQDFGDSKLLAAVHWGTALLFIAFIPLMILWCGLYRIIKGNKMIWIPVIFFHLIYFIDIIVMAISFINDGPSEGKNGIMEFVCLGLTFIIFLLANNTSLFDNGTEKTAAQISGSDAVQVETENTDTVHN